MHPEQPRTGLALQGRQADSAPRGMLSTGLLQGLVQSARPLSFCFWLPRVHAADVTAAQPAQMPSTSSSASPAASPLPAPSSTPTIIGKPEFPDTGWDRIKDLFDRELVLLFLLDLTFPPPFGVKTQRVDLADTESSVLRQHSHQVVHGETYPRKGTGYLIE